MLKEKQNKKAKNNLTVVKLFTDQGDYDESF